MLMCWWPPYFSCEMLCFLFRIVPKNYNVDGDAIIPGQVALLLAFRFFREVLCSKRKIFMKI
jgi:hypothetical protein